MGRTFMHTLATQPLTPLPASPCCSVLALVRVRSAGCPAWESVAAYRGRSSRCCPAADRTPALQYGSTSLHLASEYGHAAVVQTLLQHGADVAATDNVGAAGVPRALAWRCARECLHAMNAEVAALLNA